MAESLSRFIGRSPDTLTYAERRQLGGLWIALEVYSPKTLPLRQIEAIGASASDCIRDLRARGLDPSNYEFLPIRPA